MKYKNNMKKGETTDESAVTFGRNNYFMNMKEKINEGRKNERLYKIY